MLRQHVNVAAFSILILVVLVGACGKDKPTDSGGNTAPTASFTVTPATGDTLTSFEVDASASSDAQDAVSALQVRWDWENDGTWDTGWSTTKTANHQYQTTGTKTVRLSVKDTGALSDDATGTVTVTSSLSVTVTIPNGGENWTVGSPDTIRWTSTGSVGNVKMDYSINGGSTWSPVVASTANSGSYPWTVPNSPSTTCRVKVSSVGTPSIYDISDANFTISSLPTVTVTVPNAGENWTVGSADTIRWSSTGSVGDVKIEYSTNGGSTWSSVVTSTSDTGSYPWMVPNSPSTTCRVKVSSVGTPSIYDISDADFTISPALTPGEMVLVPAGMFEMGDGVASCGTQHQVTLTNSFHLGKYEVTNREYRDALQWAYDQDPKMVTVSGDSVNDNLDGSTTRLVDLASSYCQISFDGGAFTVDSGKENYPMVEVSWCGAAAYCDWLSMSEGRTRAYNHSTWECNGGDPYSASGYRLPTDAEWEYATQYGGERTYPWGDESPDCSRANFYNDYFCVGGTSPVGNYPAAPASLGLYDMAGNVLEWCNDWLTCDLGTSSQSNPTGPSAGSYRVLRGGSWANDNDFLRCASRYSLGPSSAGDFGFRCARSQ
jgi:formylglycine-generating enzyme required for sulfatase activity